jgi:hypothetical protein
MTLPLLPRKKDDLDLLILRDRVFLNWEEAIAFLQNFIPSSESIEA